MNYIYPMASVIKPDWNVLDVGGAAQPFKRADAVIDFEPYDKRSEANGFYRNLSARYSRGSWVQQDICDHAKKWPFKDKQFDFALCAQTLEDVRDPLYVCKEMQRVAKRGFIEMPSRFYEQTLGMEVKGLAGNIHHRWIGTIEDNTLVFHFKSHDIHKYGLKPPFFNRYTFLNLNYEALGVFWEDHFNYREDTRGAIRNDGSFFRETREMANEIGPQLWNQKAKLPVELITDPSLSLRLTDINDCCFTEKRLNPYTIKRRRSPESIQYEFETQNSLR